MGWTHFGLGESGSAEIRVTWPDGEVGEWIDVEADRFVTLHRYRQEPVVFDPMQD
jgi:hypothetical protein